MKVVVNLVEDGDLLIIDLGIIIEEVVKVFISKKVLMVMINGLNIVYVLVDIDDVNVFMFGG